jgi:hypothetical protein
MNKKRMFRPKGKNFAPTPHPKMQRANELMAIEDYTGAARAIEDLAKVASSRNGPAAPHLYIQAGRAYILAGQITDGLTNIQMGLKLFADREEWLKFRRNRWRVVRELRESGYENEAKALKNFLSEEMPADMKLPANEPQHDPKPVARARATLPTHCQECGAPLRINEVEWVDENTAECPYCGNITRS